MSMSGSVARRGKISPTPITLRFYRHPLACGKTVEYISTDRAAQGGVCDVFRKNKKVLFRPLSRAGNGEIEALCDWVR